jgi:UDP-N-acetyl-D-glucosamine/UDP-N-acetyl-D-galactosamine dehydrogenase
MKDLKLCVVGLGYVGLPLAIAFGKKQRTYGFDISERKIGLLKRGIDPMREVSQKDLKASDIEYSSDPKVIRKANFIIVAVPTPITAAKVPDLAPLESSSEIVGKNLAKGAIVVYESTVYPGATEEVCIPILEKNSGLRCGVDFKVGYSPERINPGDIAHSVEKIVKVVSGMDSRSLDRGAAVYSTVIKAGVHKASSIRVAEAAKVIENIQRDLNIALTNELSLIFDRIGIDTREVIEAAATKWNFHRYHPGLVGGHCIGVDPYYLTYKAQQLGYEPQIILAGRAINESMAAHVAQKMIKALSRTDKPLRRCKFVILGLTFKENINDYRNSKARDVISELKRYNISVIGCDPQLEDGLVKQVFDVDNVAIDDIPAIDGAILITPHTEFKGLDLKRIRSKMGRQPVLVDIRGFYPRKEAEAAGFIYDTL